MHFITISGLDGSGKSTQIELLKTHLISQNKRAFYFHAIQSGIAAKINAFKNKYCLICKLIGKCKINTPKKSVTDANSFQIALRKLFLRIDIWRFKKLREKLENSGMDYILSDRYFYDTIVNIKYLENKASCKKSGCNEINTFITPDTAIYLNVEPEQIMQREQKPDQGSDYLKNKKRLYDEYAPIWNMKIINGNRSKKDISAEIKNLIAQ